MPDSSLTFVDLFCGAGGLSLGFRQAGFHELLAVDNSESAVSTHRTNLGNVAEIREISLSSPLPEADVIIGGPPCQGFSSAGHRREGDVRNSLVSVFAELVARMRPRAFVFENVEGFLTAEGGQRVFDLLSPVISAGYRVHLRKLNAANYGVPQHRKRVIAVGGLGWTPTFPRPTHKAYGAPGAEHVGDDLPDCPSIVDALRGLPEPSPLPPGEPDGHFTSAVSEADKERIERLGAGHTMRDLPEHLRHPSYNRRANRRVQDGTPTERRGGAPAGLRRLLPNEPSKAITSGARNEFVHPLADRYLTLRECARIQTFPDTFRFTGSLSQQLQQIGNAVPPLLAHALARPLYLAMQEEAWTACNEPGELVTFVATHSSGMSPALARIVELVHTEFAPEPVVEDLPLWR